MNSEKNKSSEPHVLILKLTDYILYQIFNIILSIF